MKICSVCNALIPTIWTDPKTGLKHNFNNRKYCLVCSPFGKHNTKQLTNAITINAALVKTCPKCKEVKELNLFYSRKNKTASSYCKSCYNIITLERQRQRKRQAIKYKGGKCEICGYSKCQDAFDFHHKNPEEKEFDLGAGRFTSFDKYKNELDKCMLLCANCHREIHSVSPTWN